MKDRRCVRGAAILMTIIVGLAPPALANSLNYDFQSYHEGLRQSPDPSLDFVWIYGEPGTGEGDFEDASGAPDMEGWTGAVWSDDCCWRIDSYHAGNLQPGNPNHAWWCGKNYPPCDSNDPAGGYGNNWFCELCWEQIVDDPMVPTQVSVQAVLNYDTEPGYDYLYLQAETAVGWVTIQTWNGLGSGVSVNESFTYQPPDYVGTGDTVRLRWLFTSDGGWSDEDCQWPTAGAAQIDLIEVWLNGALKTSDDQEGETNNWTSGCGRSCESMAKSWEHLEHRDQCCDNTTPQLAFIDDTTPSYGETWTYGPNGMVVNPNQPGLYDVAIKRFVWPDPALTGAILGFDVYRHEQLINGSSPGLFYVWHVRSTADASGDSGWTEWRDAGFVYYGDPECLRHEHDLTGLLVTAPALVEIALGVRNLGSEWGYSGSDASPAPYFDNVTLIAFPFEGAALSARDIDLAQDNFPANGVIDYGNLCNNGVRFDAARNIGGHLNNIPGDLLTIRAELTTPGSVFAHPVRMYYTVKQNPAYDMCRNWPPTGYVDGTTSSGELDSGEWYFDLPDEDFLYPGDVVHYYFQADVSTGGSIVTTTLPADLTGYGVFQGDPAYVPLRYPSVFIMRALPTLRSGTPVAPPKILFWNDTASRGGEDEWTSALANLGLFEGDDYDLFYTNGPSSAVGNGLGGRATTAQLDGYSTILYTSGAMSRFTLSDADPLRDNGHDLDLLSTWLGLGGKNLFLTGEDLVQELEQSTIGSTFNATYIGANYVDDDIQTLIHQSSPQAKELDGNGVITMGTGPWGVSNYPECCCLTSWFDAIKPVAPAVSLAEFLSPSGTGGAYPYTAALRKSTSGGNVVTLPYAFRHMTSLAKNIALRTNVLHDVLQLFTEPFGTSQGVPSPSNSIATMPPGGYQYSVLVVPTGSGPPLSMARNFNPPYQILPLSITVTLYDGVLNPIYDYPAEDIWLESVSGCMNICCPSGTIADHDTDLGGMTTISHALCAGGCSADPSAGCSLGMGANVIVNNSVINGGPLPIEFNSPDMDGDGKVSLTDLVLFAPCYLGGSYHYCCDLYYDGSITLSDVVTFATYYNLECGP